VDRALTGSITYTLIEGDALTVDADVLALKHAQRFQGVDRQVASRLSRAGVAIPDPLVAPGDHVLLESMGLLRAPRVLFLGTPPLDDFGYHEIRRLSHDTLGTLARIAPTTRSVAMTLQGPGFGLDEVEAALAQLGGCRDALYGGDLGADLERICIVERDPRRCERVGGALEETLSALPDARRVPADRFGWRLTVPAVASRGLPPLGGADAGVTDKPHAFVAMPFTSEMDDVFHYGIQIPVRSHGFIVERVDQEAFTGEILSHIKRRIEAATVVIADLTGANPNVYLEVGYAWGCGRPCILLIHGDESPRFDLVGTKHLRYERIRDLERKLGAEVARLREKGLIG
jgi:hypothetical protein